MQTLTLHTRVGKDGVLKIETPIDVTDAEVEVVLVVHPKSSVDQPLSIWTENFLREILGGWEGTRLVREPQGMYETRNDFK